MFLPTTYVYNSRALMRQRLRTSRKQDTAINTDMNMYCRCGNKVANGKTVDARETPTRHNAHPSRRLPNLAYGHSSHRLESAVPRRNVSVEIQFYTPVSY
jgi:hypothetical protein